MTIIARMAAVNYLDTNLFSYTFNGDGRGARGLQVAWQFYAPFFAQANRQIDYDAQTGYYSRDDPKLLSLGPVAPMAVAFRHYPGDAVIGATTRTNAATSYDSEIFGYTAELLYAP